MDRQVGGTKDGVGLRESFCQLRGEFSRVNHGIVIPSGSDGILSLEAWAGQAQDDHSIVNNLSKPE